MRPVLVGALLASAFSSVQGQWQFALKKDEMTDEQRATFALRATVQTQNSFGVATTPILLLRCSGGRLTDLFVSVDTYVGEQANVQIRWDGGTPYEDVWSESTNGTALFAHEPDSLVDSLLSHRKLVFRFFPPGGNPQTTTFLLVPLAPRDVALKKHCGFSATRRRAENAEKFRAALRRAGNEIVSIELTPPQDSIELAEGEVVLSRTLVKRVKNKRGATVPSYGLEFQIAYAGEGRVMSYTGDTLPLQKGTNVVTVIVNGVPAERVLTYIVK
jgi:hypothetical protein